MSDHKAERVALDFPGAPDEAGESTIGESMWGGGSAPSLPSVDSDDRLFDDNDSAVDGMSNASSTVSLRPSIYDHVKENGRTYHSYKKGKYFLPNDEQEQERLDIQHALFVFSMGNKLNLAPIGDSPHNVLDFATGTGIWAIDFAQQYPSAQVLGTDLSAIQPLYVPPNCRFEIDDAEDEWIFSEKFDFIHGRAVVSCFKDPASVLREAFKSLAPGGYLEMQDMLFPFQFLGDPPTETALYKWTHLIAEGAAKLERPWTNVKHYKRWMEEIGFENVVEKNFYWPFSMWAKGDYYKQVSLYAQVDFLNGLEGLSLKIMGSMGYPADEIKAFVQEVMTDVKNPAIHFYCSISVVYGRKPMESS